jgi:hypothetical protein
MCASPVRLFITTIYRICVLPVTTIGILTGFSLFHYERYTRVILYCPVCGACFNDDTLRFMMCMCCDALYFF